jgi:3-dehydroquinate dehydratase I
VTKGGKAQPAGRSLAIGNVALSADTPRIVAAGGEAELAALAAATDADLVEVRADLFDDPQPTALPAQLDRVRRAGRPVILTVRAVAEGGKPLDEARRRALYLAGLPHVDAIDVEIASGDLVAELLPRAREAGVTVVLSAHVLDGTPPEATLLALVDRAEALGADVTKLATRASTLEELRALVSVTLAARTRGVVTLALGPLGPLSRLVLPAAGSLLTYGHVGGPTAPGQLPVSELAPLVARLFRGVPG